MMTTIGSGRRQIQIQGIVFNFVEGGRPREISRSAPTAWSRRYTLRAHGISCCVIIIIIIIIAVAVVVAATVVTGIIRGHGPRRIKDVASGRAVRAMAESRARAPH